MRDFLIPGSCTALALAGAALGGCVPEEPAPGSGSEASEVPVAIVSRATAPCADPGERQARGPFEERQREVPPLSDIWTWGGGVTVADLDEDGWLDTLSTVEPGVALYPGSADGAFDSVGEDVFAGVDLSYASGTSVADYDGDGDLDVYVTRVRGLPILESAQTDDQGRNVLLRNEGDGRTFTDVTDEAGVHACGVHHRTKQEVCFRSMSSSWGDYDGDGDLDLFVGNYGYVDETPNTEQEDMAKAEPSFLFANRGDGTFEDVSEVLPVPLHDGYTYAGGFVDVDGDLDLDLYTVNDFGRVARNRVLWNEGGAFVARERDRSGLELELTGMGMGVADFNRDGFTDFVIPQWAANVLLLSTGDGRWTDASNATGLRAQTGRNQVVGWGGETGDVDNDGDLDVLVQFGYLPNGNAAVWGNPRRQPDALYLNDTARTDRGDLRVAFRDVADNWGVAHQASTRAAVFADLDRDGWLDVAKRNLTGPSMVLLSRCGEEKSLTVHLRQPGSMNTHAIGARVTVTSAGRVQTRMLLAGGTGYVSSGPPELHFGLGLAPLADRVEVTWPDGGRSSVAYVPAMQEITLIRK